jgi:hypothetical protein
VADGELDEDELHPPPTIHCHQETPLRCHPRDDDEGDGYQKRPRARSFIGRVSNRMESRSKNRDIYPSRVRDSSWYRGNPQGEELELLGVCRHLLLTSPS